MRKHTLILLVSIIVIGLALAPPYGAFNLSHTTRSPAGPSSPRQSSASSGVYFDHVVIIIMEDQGIQDVCGQSPPPCSSSTGAQYLSGLANSYTVASQYLGVSHFSEADYLALIGGDTFGCGNKGCPPVSNPNLVDRLETAGLTWKGYLEDQNVASGCDTTYHEPYTPEHNPFVGFTDILNNPARCAKVVLANPSSCSVTDCALVNDLNSASSPNFMWLTPNNCDNMHGFSGICPKSISMGDNYLSSLVPKILSSKTFTQERSALFIVFDEGNSYCPLNGSSEDCVFASWIGSEVKTSFASKTLYNHYSATKTIELNWNLQSLTSNDANATPMTEFLTSPLSTSFTYTPVSPQTGQQISFAASSTGGNSPYSYDWNFGDGSTGTGSSVSHTYSSARSFTVLLTEKDSSSPQQTATSQQSITVSSGTPALTASFRCTPSTPQTGQTVSFTGSATGGVSPYSYSWNFGDGAAGTGSTTSHVFASAGTFKVTLTVKDSASPQNTVTSQQSLTVSSPTQSLTASYTFTPSKPQTGQSVSFTASASGGRSPYSYSWNFGDGATGTGQSTSHTFQSAGSFTVVLTVTDSNATRQPTVSRQTIVVTSPPATLTSSFSYTPTSVQTGQTVSFDATANGGTSPYQYSWNFGDGTTGSGSTVTHAYSNAGSFTVTLTTTDSGSPQQTAESQQTISVQSPPSQLTGSFTYSPSSPETGQQITFSGTASGGTSPYSFSWNFGDGSTGSGSSTSHSYSAAGSYTVTLAVTDNGSPQQTTSSQETITITSTPAPLSASFTYSPSSPVTGQQASFTGTATGGTSPYSFSWDFGDGSTGTGSSTTHTYSSVGTYTVVLTVTDGGSSGVSQQTASSQNSITVTSPPSTLTTGFTFNPSSPQTGQSVSFTGTASGGTSPYTYSWAFGDGSTGTGSSTAYTYSTAGSYTVTLTVTDSGSPQQTTTAQQTITVTNPPQSLSASFSYNPSSPQTSQQVTFSASASGGTAPYTFNWSFGDGSTGSGSSTAHAYSTAGSYTVTLTVSDSGSPQQTVTSQQTVSVSSPPPPPLSASFTFSPSNPDAKQSISLAASASGGISPYSYSWDFGDGGSGSGGTVVHSYRSGGTYTISLTVSDSNGQSAKSSQTITVAAPLTGSFSYSPTNPLPAAAVSFTASASGGSGPYSYSWNFGDGSTGSGATVSHSYLLPGSYTVTLTITDGNGQTYTASQTITVLTSLA